MGDPSVPRATNETNVRAVRVMHVVYGLEAGGMEMGVVKLVNGLDRSRVQSAICSTTAGGALKALINPATAVFELNRRPGNDPRLVAQLYRLFRRVRPDIVHTHAWGTLLEGLIAARLARVPIVIHGEHGTLQLRAYQRWFQRRAWSAVDQVLSVSTRLAERIEHETGFPVHRIRTIRNGVDLSRFGVIDREAARGTLGLDTGATVAVAVGRLVPVKAHMTLLDAVARLHAVNLPITLAIAGEGPLKAALTQKAESLGITHAVRLLGHRADVEVVLAAGDVFTLSSASEGLSNTILEAMASWLPVVATRVGGADELVVHGETGLLVEPGSPDKMSEALASIVTDRARAKQMGAAGRARAETEFSLTKTVGRYESLYLEAAGATASTSKPGASRSLDVERFGVA